MITLSPMETLSGQNSTHIFFWVRGESLQNTQLRFPIFALLGGRPDSWMKSNYHAGWGCGCQTQWLALCLPLLLFPNPKAQASKGWERERERHTQRKQWSRTNENKSTCSGRVATEWWWMLEFLEWTGAHFIIGDSEEFWWTEQNTLEHWFVVEKIVVLAGCIFRWLGVSPIQANEFTSDLRDLMTPALVTWIWGHHTTNSKSFSFEEMQARLHSDVPQELRPRRPARK